MFTPLFCHLPQRFFYSGGGGSYNVIESSDPVHTFLDDCPGIPSTGNSMLNTKNNLKHTSTAGVPSLSVAPFKSANLFNANRWVFIDDAFNLLSCVSMMWVSTSDRHSSYIGVPSLSVAPKMAATCLLAWRQNNMANAIVIYLMIVGHIKTLSLHDTVF